jgi:hypothetical protein
MLFRVQQCSSQVFDPLEDGHEEVGVRNPCGARVVKLEPYDSSLYLYTCGYPGINVVIMACHSSSRKKAFGAGPLEPACA